MPTLGRNEVQEEFKWNLRDLFASDEEWRRRKKEMVARLSRLDEFKGTLSASSVRLLDALNYLSELEKEFILIAAYATMLSDQDTRQSEPLAMKQEMVQLRTQLSSAASFIEPEILRIPEQMLNAYLDENVGLSPYRHSLEDAMRRREHTLDDVQERLIAEAGLMADTAEEAHSILVNADMPYRVIKLSDGTDAKIDPTGYTLHRTRQQREDRINVFNAFFEVLKGFERTLGTELYGELKKNLFYREVRKYRSCLESALFPDNIPEKVYLNLLENVNANLPSLHRYLELRKRLLGLDQLHYYDLYPSMVKEVDLRFSYGEAKKAVLDAMAPLGGEYLGVLNRALSERWIDVLPNEGKRAGAYMEGHAYDVHPYVLTNFNGRYDDVSTLAHELGHAVHSSFSNHYQHFANSSYPIFLAEVASTVNEALLMNYHLERIKDKAERVSLLGGYLEGFRTTMFRQTQFAEFELRIHEAAEGGEALAGERLTSMYLDILKRYYGHEKICVIDDLYGVEWAYIPHFYMDFYVYQYATSFTASQAIASRIIEGDKDLIERYIGMLKSGSSEYAIPTLKKVGVDMLSREPFDLAMKRMNEIIAEIEDLI